MPSTPFTERRGPCSPLPRPAALSDHGGRPSGGVAGASSEVSGSDVKRNWLVRARISLGNSADSGRNGSAIGLARASPVLSTVPSTRRPMLQRMAMFAWALEIGSGSPSSRERACRLDLIAQVTGGILGFRLLLERHGARRTAASASVLDTGSSSSSTRRMRPSLFKTQSCRPEARLARRRLDELQVVLCRRACLPQLRPGQSGGFPALRDS